MPATMLLAALCTPPFPGVHVQHSCQELQLRLHQNATKPALQHTCCVIGSAAVTRVILAYLHAFIKRSVSWPLQRP